MILESAECEMWHAILSLTVLYICQEVFCPQRNSVDSWTFRTLLNFEEIFVWEALV